MQMSDLRIALFSGNYNMTTDGANRALNRLVEYLLRQGAKVRVYSPTIAEPAFAPTGDLVSLPSIAIPGRSEYRFPMALNRRVRRDLAAFDPNVVHVSSPDISAHRAVTWARHRGLPVLSSVHTRFDTYPRYYNMAWAEPLVTAGLRRFYRRCDALVTPSESMAQVLRDQRMNYDIGIWSRGVDRTVFNPQRRDMAWRQSLGIADQEVAVGFLGRLVMEKGLDVFSDTIDELNARGIAHRVLVVGEGPARDWFEARLPDAVFAGFQGGSDLGRAVASMDVLFNPSITETFGNVTLEAMACGLPVVAAAATGSESLVDDGVSGRLVRPGAIHQFAEALRGYVEQPDLRARHGAAGEERSKAFSWDRINQAVADTYLRLIRHKPRARA
ncbi:glycosyltransferase involved in cell wall biosynthesis [Novosphingobium kunmingense]|uniref:Glycosyltransferase involved in cell wall biosynthesis n=1 Tax=Novosphingobium kunmingense TaxID=1211806 RepID=A0A2N0HL21_9SPHN|nr:glycosyltransferase family 1 protein [Novosphingobium kunmingense]PKB19609.1 glycosyltransferase involved in cell wall biosynthesis [Novosphingobium kunmingense]